MNTLTTKNNHLSSSVFLLVGLFAGITLTLILSVGFRMGFLLAIAIAMGIALAASRFSFSAAYRQLLQGKPSSGVQAQIIFVALSAVLFMPFLQEGTFDGASIVGAIAPVGLGGVFGAFLFGIGMQLAGACASGTLYSAASGSPRMVLVLIFFCAGSFWGSLDLSFWSSLPQTSSIVLGPLLGWGPALFLQLSILTAFYIFISRVFARKDEGLGQSLFSLGKPLFIAAISLAILNLATLLVAGHPWTITWGFTLVGAKVALLLGWEPSSSAFWSSGFQLNALERGFWHDVTTVMNLGILVGAGAVAVVMKVNRKSMRIHWKSALAAVVGGLMLGYGARLAYGCNIGAMVSGIASTSVHGWLWLIFALMGNWIGIKGRPLFNLQN